ncbi:MAG: hypothetical protein WBO36_14190, partial [Saprospiraceae bacterium]
AIACAPNNGIVQIEYPVYDQTIQLSSPLVIDKNITINGFFNQKISLNTSVGTGAIFSIAPNTSVTINGLNILCNQGGTDGRCIINEGQLVLDNITMFDPTNNGNGSIINNDGQIIIKNNVVVKK